MMDMKKLIDDDELFREALTLMSPDEARLVREYVEATVRSIEGVLVTLTPSDGRPPDGEV